MFNLTLHYHNSLQVLKGISCKQKEEYEDKNIKPTLIDGYRNLHLRDVYFLVSISD